MRYGGRQFRTAANNVKRPNSIIAYLRKFKRYFIFIFGGGVGALVNWGISFLLTSIMGVHYVISYSMAQIANIVVNFVWHRFITFGVKSESASRFIKFFTMSILTALLSIALVYLVKEFVLDYLYTITLFRWDLNYLVAIIFITFVISIVNYIISTWWVFKEPVQ